MLDVAVHANSGFTYCATFTLCCAQRPTKLSVVQVREALMKGGVGKLWVPVCVLTARRCD